MTGIRWGMHEERLYDLNQFINLLYGTAVDDYGETPTKHQLGRACADALNMTGNTDCVWCGVDAWDLGEDFYVHDELWERYGPARGVLCVGCLERIMGRRLTPKDLKGYSCVLCHVEGLSAGETQEKCPHMSARLRSRLTG